MKIGVLSNGPLCLPLLQLLTTNRIPIHVFTDLSSPHAAADFPTLNHFCQSFRIPLNHDDPKTLYGWLEQVKPDIVFIIGFGQLIDLKRIPQRLVSSFYNIHFGALPDFKGPNPVFWQFKKGVDKLTVSIHRINEKYDCGPVVWLKQIPRAPHLNYGTAHTILSHVSTEGVVFILNHFVQKKNLVEIPRDESKAKYYKRPAAKDIIIEWEHMSAQEITDLAKACNPWNKGASTIYNGNEVKIIDAERNAVPTTGRDEILPGTILNVNGQLEIACKNNESISVTMLNLDSSFVAARYATQYGFVQGKRFGK